MHSFNLVTIVYLLSHSFHAFVCCACLLCFPHVRLLLYILVLPPYTFLVAQIAERLKAMGIMKQVWISVGFFSIYSASFCFCFCLLLLCVSKSNFGVLVFNSHLWHALIDVSFSVHFCVLFFRNHRMTQLCILVFLTPFITAIACMFVFMLSGLPRRTFCVHLMDDCRFAH